MNGLDYLPCLWDLRKGHWGGEEEDGMAVGLVQGAEASAWMDGWID